MPRRFDAVLFDFSGVMVSSAFDLIGVLGESSGLSREATLEFLLGPYDRDTDHVWHRVERGEVSVLDWVVDVQSRSDAAGHDIDLSQMRSMLGELEIYDQMADCARSLRSDSYKTALVTNNIAEAREQWRPLFPLDELFDLVVDSSEVGMRKPNPEIYLQTCRQLEVAPERAVMLDDHEGNLVGARVAGLSTVLVVDPDDAIAELRALLA